MKVAQPKGNNAHQFQGQRSKVNVIKSTNDESRTASYFPKGKAYELQTWYTDGQQRPVSPTSAMTSKVKSQGRDVTQCVWQVLTHKSRTQSPRNIEIRIGRLPTPRVIRLTIFKVKGQRSRSPNRLMLKSKVCRLPTSNLVGGWCMRYQLPWPTTIKACDVGLLHVGEGIPCSPHTATATQLVVHSAQPSYQLCPVRAPGAVVFC